jgi:PilZ domain
MSFDSTSPSAAPANAMEKANVATNAEADYQGPEKRRSPRYKCEGSVHIREENSESFTRASFTDVSLHGCYVEAQSTYPVGSILHMKLEANRTCVEVRGQVRVCYSYLGMGIAFIEMSDQNRALLRELLGALSRPSVIVVPANPSLPPTLESMETMPAITNPSAVVKALIESFEKRRMLTREDFLRIVHQTQAGRI